MSEALQRIKARATAYPCGEGTFLHDAFAPVAAEIDYLFGVVMPAALDAVMPDTALGGDLDRVANAYAVERRPAAKAFGEVTFSGTAGTVILESMPLATQSGLVYLVTSGGVIPEAGTIALPVEAALSGVLSNVDAGQVTIMPTPVVGIASVTNAAPISGGADVELDEALRERLLLRLRLPSSSGTAGDYVRWALEVPGVAAAQCIPLWNGNGTVKVIIAGIGMTNADAGTIERAQSYIDSVRPIGALVTVVSAVALTINVALQITVSEGYTKVELQSPIEQAIAAFMQSHGFGATYLSQARMGAAILEVPGVADYANLTLNGTAGNLAITPESVPAIGTVTIT